MSDASLVLREVRPWGASDAVDVVIRGGVIAEIAPTGTARGGEIVEAAGRHLGPGLWDAHVHFTQWSIRQGRLDLSATQSAADVLGIVHAALSSGAPRTHGILVGYGFRDGLWPVPATRNDLEEVTGPVPVVLISADLHCAWMTSSAAALLHVSLDGTGIVREAEWMAALQILDRWSAPTMDAYRATAEDAARRGVVGIAEYENADNQTEWPARVAAGVTSLRVEASVWPDRLEEVLAAGLRTGDALDDAGLVRMGRLKVIVDGSLNTRTAWCWDPYPGRDPHSAHACGVESVPISELRRLLARATAGAIPPAVHAIGDRANTEVLDVFAALGTGGVIEHAQLLRREDIPRFAALGLAASVQPEHAMDDRDVAEHYWAGRTDRTFAFAALHAAGAELRLGSDAPVSPLDPWVAISAAVTRRRDGRAPWHPEQSLPREVALASSARSRVRVGEPADLVLTDRDPLTSAEDALREMPVAATLLGGRFTWRDL